MQPNLYTIPLKDSDGRNATLAKYASKNVLLIVNVASNCGLAKQNYEGLADLANKYAKDGLQVLLFPSNDFFQEPRAAKKVKEITDAYSDKFVVYDKISVWGSTKHPLYKYLTENYDNGWFGNVVKWNFTKFLVDRAGRVRMRYGPTDCIESVKDKDNKMLVEVLNEKGPVENEVIKDDHL